MKNTRFYWIIGICLFIIFSCKKEVVDPIPDTSCSTCSCMGIDTVVFSDTLGENQKTFDTTAYSPVFYSSSFVQMQGRYVDYSAQGNFDGECQIMRLSPAWQNQNSNFSGRVLRLKDVDVKLSGLATWGYKKLAFDVNKQLGDFTFKVNGVDYNASNAIITTTALANGYRIEIIEHPLYEIELGGLDVAIDNLCRITRDSFAICTPFGDSSYVENIPTTQTAYGPQFNTSFQAPFRIKYVDYDGNGSPGSMGWGVSSASISGENVGFSGGVLQVNNCDLEVDLSVLIYTNKRVSFDISNTWNMTNPNEFNVNENGLGALPAGVSSTVMNLGTAGNGNPCYRVVIEGPINTFVLKGWQTSYDNLCIEPI